MKNKKNILLYDFDFKYEYRTYRNVGLDYIPKGMGYKIRNFLNKNEKRYKKCNTYKEWKEYISNKTSSKQINNENKIRFLYYKKRYHDNCLETVSIIMGPIILAFYSMGIAIWIEDIKERSIVVICSIILAIFIIFFIYFICISNRRKNFFYDDYIEVLKSISGSEEKMKELE